MVEKCIAKGDGTEEIAARLPARSAVAVVAASEAFAGEYMRKLRRKSLIARFIKSSDDDCEIGNMETDDDVRMIVGYGGEKEIDCAKRLAYLRKRPVYAAIASPDAITVFSPRAELVRGNLVLLFACAVPFGAAVACEEMSAALLPSGFGAVCAAAVGLCDSEAYLRAVGKSADASVRESAYNTVYAAIDIASARGRASASLGAEIARLALDLSLLSFRSGLSFVRGAADDCARAVRMLCMYEQRECMPRGELAFVFAAHLAEMYGELCETDLSLALPPDNNLRAQCLCEYFGFDELTAARAAVSRLKELSLAAYRVREYRDELGACALDALKAAESAKKTFRRMYSDDGYSLTRAIEPSEIRLCTALAPDMFAAAGSALMLMREFGLLERYIRIF